jgi:hypothetical protein
MNTGHQINKTQNYPHPSPQNMTMLMMHIIPYALFSIQICSSSHWLRITYNNDFNDIYDVYIPSGNMKRNMKLPVKIVAGLLLAFNASGAFYGGISMMLFPDGSRLGMNISQLQHSPFTSYFIPGIVLLLANGVLSLLALAALFTSHRKYGHLVLLQGIVLTGWIVIQITMLQVFHPLHLVLGITGIALILLGIFALPVKAEG